MPGGHPAKTHLLLRLTAILVTDGIIFDIKRFAVHDGPGIRTTVFFKGCPLSCWWCHNPESRGCEPQKSVRHLAIEGKVFEKEEVTGYHTTVEEIVRQAERDRIFYEESNGGVTLSGGEPLHQPQFCTELLQMFSECGFHTALDTTGYAPEEILRETFPFTNLYLYDLKLMDEEAHMNYTGVSNRVILDNLTMLYTSGQQVIIRFPVIPGITDTDENITAMADFLAQYHHATISPPEIHLLPYHNTAKNKYRRFQMDDLLKDQIHTNPSKIPDIKDHFSRAGFLVNIGG